MLLCPGQGAQTPGMGRALFDEYPEVRAVFGEGKKAAGRDLEALCFDTPADILSRTENAQLALFTVSMGVWSVLSARGFMPCAAAGFSLGELSALCAAGVFSLADGFRLVDFRARAMQRAADASGGGMSVVMGLAAEDVERIAAELGGDAAPVNFNTPVQVTLAGPLEALEALEEACRAAGAKRVLRLQLSGAFHTAAMNGAGEELMKMAEGIAFHASAFPVYVNPTAAALPEDAEIPAHLKRQMTSPVRWRETIGALSAQGMRLYAEAGCGKVLSGMVTKTDGEARCVQTDTPAALEAAMELLKG